MQAEQLPLDFAACAAPRRAPTPPAPREPTIQERFEVFHRENPHVLRALVKAARKKKDGGARRISVKQLWEDLRADQDLITEHGGPFKADNRLTAPYARAILAAAPELGGLIELRGGKGAA